MFPRSKKSQGLASYTNQRQPTDQAQMLEDEYDCYPLFPDLSQPWVLKSTNRNVPYGWIRELHLYVRKPQIDEPAHGEEAETVK